MLRIRPLGLADITAVIAADAAAFRQQYARLFGAAAAAHAPVRTTAQIAAYRSRQPDGCFVAEMGGEIVGATFSRVAGSLGWFYALSVRPDMQGQGIGRALIARTTDFFAGRGVTVPALMTFPTADENIALYSRLGFRPAFLTMALARDLTPPPPTPSTVLPLPDLPARLRRDLPERVAALCAPLLPGLDHWSDVAWAMALPLAEVLCLRDGDDLRGFAILYSIEGAPEAELKLLVLPGNAPHAALATLLDGVAAFAAARGHQRLRGWCNSRDWATLQWLLAHGWRLVPSPMLRLVGANRHDIVDEGCGIHLLRLGG